MPRVTVNIGRGGTAEGAETRDRILRAAEVLLADQGIDGVSLREINRAAGQSNTAAVQYYFGDRDGLLTADGPTCARSTTRGTGAPAPTPTGPGPTRSRCRG